MLLAGISVVAIGGYLLFVQISAVPAETSIAPSIASLTETVRKTSHNIAQILARPSFAVAHKPPPAKYEDSSSGDSSDVADASSPAATTGSADESDRAGDARAADAGRTSGSAAASDPAWDDRKEGLKDAIAYLNLAPKYPAVRIESAIAPFGFAQSSATQNNSVQNNSAQNNSAQSSNARNAQNSIGPNSPAPNGVAPSRHGERSGNSVSGTKSFRMPPPPHAEIPIMMPEPRPPRLTAVQDMSRQESPGSSSSIIR
jgi:hypothetical protein